ncbi:MAG TPA: hypothetical protein VK956_12610 [Verrucomicrobium sp.]|nr:hypothetical protein [Verrucomicrobium sp.]
MMTISIRKTISAKPWLLVVAVFVGLIVMWTGLIIIAVRNTPQNVPLTTVTSHDSR